MTVYFPEGVDAQGNETVIFVPALADPSAPTVTELTGATAVNLSCALRGFSPNSEQNSVADIRLCSREQFESPGRVTNSIDDITYVYQPQTVGATTPDADNAAYDALAQGVTGYLIDRRGLDARETAVIADQLVDVYPVKMGAQRRVGVDATAEGAKFEIIQKPFVTGPVLPDIKVVTA